METANILNETEAATEPAWKNVDLVLDAIMKHLTVKELKLFRETCRAFAVAGARVLARKTLVRLTGIVDLRPVSETVPVLIGHGNIDADFWECDCALDNPKQYFRIDSYLKYLESTVFDSGFAPKNISVVSCSDVWQLPSAHLASLEDLQVLTYRPMEGLKLLNEFHLLLPNLKSLNLQFVHPDLETESTLEFRPEEEPQDGAIISSDKILLEKLAITVSAAWPQVGSNVFRKFQKLKVFSLKWSGEFKPYPTGYHDRTQQYRFSFLGDLYADWLENSAFTSLSLLNDVSLRFDLTPNNTLRVQQVLNSMKLRSLSLEFHGIVSEVCDFISGLGSTAMTALSSLHFASVQSALRYHCPFPLVALKKHGFFDKPEWSLSVYDGTGWAAVWKTKNQIVEQLTGFFGNFFQGWLLHEIISHFPEIANQYNYSFCRVLLHPGIIKNCFERRLPPYFVVEKDGLLMDRSLDNLNCSALKGRGQPCRCTDLCNRKSHLICDFQEFLDEAEIHLPHQHLSPVLFSPGLHYCTKTKFLCNVNPTVLQKWSSVRNEKDVGESDDSILTV